MNLQRVPFPRCIPVALVAIVAFGGCYRSGKAPWQGYIEGEFVYVSSPLAGRLEKLNVTKGSRVERGAPLFELERAAEIASHLQASQQLDFIMKYC